jgi:hypothetical protein
MRSAPPQHTHATPAARTHPAPLQAVLAVGMSEVVGYAGLCAAIWFGVAKTAVPPPGRPFDQLVSAPAGAAARDGVRRSLGTAGCAACEHPLHARSRRRARG